MTAACERCGSEVPQPKRGFPGRFCSIRCRKATHKAQKTGQVPFQRGVEGPAGAGGQRRVPEAGAPVLPATDPAEKVVPLGLLYVPQRAASFGPEDKTPGQAVSSYGVGPADWGASFPGVDLVEAAAALLPAAPGWVARGKPRLPQSPRALLVPGEPVPLAEGPRPRLVVAPGSVTLERRDYARGERTQQRWLESRRQHRAYLAVYLAEHGCFPNEPEPTRVVTGFSRKSRVRMTKTLTQLDYSPLFVNGGILALGTLTYPGDWLEIASDGRVVKAHLKAFRKRFKRAWGVDLICVWKLEFQYRGAPHFHFLFVPPVGVARDDDARLVGGGLKIREWMRAVWADIVAHPDPEQRANHEQAGANVDWSTGLRSRDPKRIAVYFTKHGLYSAKEYQHVVPDEWQEPGKGPGRFWGYWGLDKSLAAVELIQKDYQAVVRILRRWVRAQGTTREVRTWRPKGGRVIARYAGIQGLAGAQYAASTGLGGARLGETGAGRWHTRRARVTWLRNSAGFVSLNDGPAFVSALARYLTADVGESAADCRARLVAATGRIHEMVQAGVMVS